MKEYPETHQQGAISFENVNLVLGMTNPDTVAYRGDFGIQIARDGRIWVCINGIAFLRFSPHSDSKMNKEETDGRNSHSRG